MGDFQKLLCNQTYEVCRTISHADAVLSHFPTTQAHINVHQHLMRAHRINKILGDARVGRILSKIILVVVSVDFILRVCRTIED